MSPVTLAELDPVTRAKALAQISGTEGDTTALALLEDNNHSSTYTDAENLARHIISRMDSVAAKLKSLEDDIRRLWIEFDNLMAGETILGCRTKKEFCEKKLHRTPQAVRYMLNPELRESKQCLPPTPVPVRTEPSPEDRYANIPNVDIQVLRRANPSKLDCELIDDQAKKEMEDAWKKLLDSGTNSDGFYPPPLKTPLPVRLEPTEQPIIDMEVFDAPPSAPAKNPDLVAKIQAHEKATVDLKMLLKRSGIDADVSRSKTDGKFHVVWHDVTTEQVHKFAETFKSTLVTSLENIR